MINWVKYPNLANYYRNAIDELTTTTRTLEKSVLEIGGSSLPKELVVHDLGVSSWTSVDLIAHDKGSYQLKMNELHYNDIGINELKKDSPLNLEQNYTIYNGDICKAPSQWDNKFDVAFSVNAFEHISNYIKALKAIKNCLKPGGILFTQFGPIWGSKVGHHIGVNEKLKFQNENALPPWSHLTYKPSEMYRFMGAQGESDKDIEQTIYQIYQCPSINRLFYEDYIELTDLVGFSTVDIEAVSTRNLEPETKERLQSFHPGYEKFDIYNMQIMCVK
jgi:SAM-dependent methyltransferase